jgi:hypothetical protein
MSDATTSNAHRGVLLPHKDRVHLDVLASEGKSVITHLLTHEQREYEGLDWYLLFDDDGYGVLCNDTLETHECLEEIFVKQVLYGTDQSDTILLTHGVGLPKEVSLVDHLRAFTEVAVSVRVVEGALAEVLEIGVFYVRSPRLGQHLFWNTSDVYKTLQLTSYGGYPSCWAYNSKTSWSKYLTDGGFEGEHVLMSPQGVSPAIAINSTDRFLPTTSMSTLCLCTCLSRFAGKLAQQGGLRHDVGKLRAGALLKHLIEGVSKVGHEWSMNVEMVPTWKCLWPRPQELMSPVLMKGLSDGRLDVSEWRKRVAQNVPKRHCLSKWWVLLASVIGDRDFAPLHEVLFLLESEPRAWSLRSQILWRLAVRIEDVAKGSESKVTRATPIVPFVARAAGFAGDNSKSDRNLRLIAKHLEATKAAVEGQRHFSFASDCAWVKELYLSNAAIGVRPNTISLLPPMVAPFVPRPFREMSGFRLMTPMVGSF